MEKEIVDSVLSFLIKRRGLKNYQGLANVLGIKPSTLSIHIKNLSNQDTLSQDFIERLSKALKVEEQHLLSLFREGLDGQDAHIKLIDHLISSFRDLEKGYQSEILDLTSKLGNGDSYTLLTSFQPIEFNDEELKCEIAQAVKKGAQFRYVYPGEELYSTIERYRTDKNSLYGGLVAKHDVYLKELVEKYQLTKQESQRIQYKTCNDPVIVNPLFKLIHLKRALIGTIDITVFTEARLGNKKSNSEIAYWYPLPKVDTQKVDAQITKLFEEQ